MTNPTAALRALEQEMRKSAYAARQEGLNTLPHIHDDYADRIAAILRQMEEPWQPISSAPKDGTLILACGQIDGGYWRSTAVWREGKWLSTWFTDEELFEPSNWMPLPQPPKGVGSET